MANKMAAGDVFTRNRKTIRDEAHVDIFYIFIKSEENQGSSLHRIRKTEKFLKN